MQIINGKFKFVSGKELSNRGRIRQLGRVFEKDGVYEHVFYCPICRKDMPGYKHDDPQTIQNLINTGRWDFEKRRMLHCGSSSCRDYQEAWDKVLIERKNKWAQSFFLRAQKAGLVA